MGVASGCGCKGYIDILILLIPTPLFFFAAASLLFVHFKNVFRSCSSAFVIEFYVLKNFFHTVYTHIRSTTGVPRQPYEGCT